MDDTNATNNPNPVVPTDAPAMPVNVPPAGAPTDAPAPVIPTQVPPAEPVVETPAPEPVQQEVPVVNPEPTVPNPVPQAPTGTQTV